MRRPERRNGSPQSISSSDSDDDKSEGATSYKSARVKGRFLEFRMYVSLLIYFLNYWKTLFTMK